MQMKCKELYNYMDKLCNAMNRIVNRLIRDDIPAEDFKSLSILSNMLTDLKGYLGEMKNEI